jgi:ribonuclease HII
VAAAVVFESHCDPIPVADSKMLSDAERRKLLPVILKHCAAVGVGIVDSEEIDRINILQASFAAMRNALGRIEVDAFIVDGSHKIPQCPLPQAAVVKADSRSISVAAASIIAKVFRDDYMSMLDARYPGYGFAQHKGYATREHFRALDALGPSPVHRSSFLSRWRERSAQESLELVR